MTACLLVASSLCMSLQLQETVLHNGLCLPYFQWEFRCDREVVYAAVENNVWALAYASWEFKNDRQLVYGAVRRNGAILRSCSQELCADRELVGLAVKNGCWAFAAASQELRGDKDLALMAVKQDGLLLKYASEEVKRERSVVKAAVLQNGKALIFAAPSLKSDRELVRLAMENNRGPLPERMRQFEVIVDGLLGKEMCATLWRWADHKGYEPDLPLEEIYARFISYPGATKNEKQDFPDLGWYFQSTLEDEDSSVDSYESQLP